MGEITMTLHHLSTKEVTRKFYLATVIGLYICSQFIMYFCVFLFPLVMFLVFFSCIVFLFYCSHAFVVSVCKVKRFIAFLTLF